MYSLSYFKYDEHLKQEITFLTCFPGVRRERTVASRFVLPPVLNAKTLILAGMVITQHVASRYQNSLNKYKSY